MLCALVEKLFARALAQLRGNIAKLYAIIDRLNQFSSSTVVGPSILNGLPLDLPTLSSI